MPTQLVVGFDLDMTLVDSADGITATMQAAARACAGGENVTLDRMQVWPWIGLPLEAMAAQLVPGADPTQVALAYRSGYAAIGVPRTRLLPGAAESIRAVHRMGGKVLVVSAKAERGVHDVLTSVGLDRGELLPDVIVGGLFAAAKGARLRHEGAVVYVGDHTGDVRAAQVADAVSVAVTTGPQAAEALRAAGADVILIDLVSFPAWLSSFMPGFTR